MGTQKWKYKKKKCKNREIQKSKSWKIQKKRNVKNQKIEK